MSLKYGLPLIFGSIGTFFIANMFEHEPDVEIHDLAEEVPTKLNIAPEVEYVENVSSQNIPAPVYHAPVYHAPVYHAPAIPTPIYSQQIEPSPTPRPAYNEPKHVVSSPPPILSEPLVLKKAPVAPKPVALESPGILAKLSKTLFSSATTEDPSIKENLELEKSKEAAAKEALRVVTAANKRADELRNQVKPVQPVVVLKTLPNTPVAPKTPKALPKALPKTLIPLKTPKALPKADIRLRGYSETDANPATLPPIGKIKPINIDAIPLSPGEIPKLKQGGGKRNSRKLKNLAHAMDLDDPYDRY